MLFNRFIRSAVRRLFRLTGCRLFLDPFSWRVIRCRYDGIDYVHTWKSGALVWFEPTPLAVQITLEDMQLFLQHANVFLGNRILIAGAGMGSEIGHFSELVGSVGLVIAIEPDRDAFRRLQKVVELLSLSNVILVNCAVGSEPGETLLYIPDSHTISNTTVKVDLFDMKSYKVEVQTIEMICTSLGIDQLDYLKMNIEGAEYSALLGLGKIWVKHFCISCHDFLGEQFKTKEKVKSKLLGWKYELFENSEIPGKPWIGSYIYANSPKPISD